MTSDGDGHLNEPVDRQLAAVVAAIRAALGNNARAVYVYGSVVSGGLKPHSDLDVFVVLDRPTTGEERGALFNALTPLSAKRARPTDWRPLEVTGAVRSTLNPLGEPPLTDFQFGEWLRGRMDAGVTEPEDPANPDLVLLVAMCRETARSLYGPPPDELIAEVPEPRVRRALHSVVPRLLEDLESDTANVLLTLARVAYTLSTSSFTSKDRAAGWALTRIDPDARPALVRARDVYIGEGRDEWDEVGEVALAADELQRLIRRHGSTRSKR